MKKFLSILAIAGVMAACNNGDDDTTSEDSAKRADSIGNLSTPATPSNDSMNMPKDSSNMPKKDSGMKK
jgi:hypothetical protein